MQDPDPYRQLKQNYNRLMLDLYPAYKELVENSADPFDRAMRLAIAGNVIDFGSKYQFDVMEQIKLAMDHPLAIDDSRELRQYLAKADTLLYIGDDSPGAVWEFASDEFRDLFVQADVVISKGQGNLEGLIEVPHDRIYFLLVTKCDLIAERIGTRVGDFVIKRGKEVQGPVSDPSG